MKRQRPATRSDSEALWDWSLESDRIHFSPQWIALVGARDHEVGTTPDEWFRRVHPEDSEQLLRDLETVRSSGPDEFVVQYRLRRKDGSYRWMSCHGIVVRNDEGQAIRLMGSQSDVTVQTVTDPVTGLPNRLLLIDRIAQSIDRAQRYKGFHFAALLIDVGRPAVPARPKTSSQDPLLTAVARRLETCLRIPDQTATLRNNDLVARVRGDLFAVLLDGLNDVNQAKDIGDRLLAEILNPFTIRGREVRLGASIGIAVSVTGYTGADDVLRDAEIALSRARVLGGSHCEFFDTAIVKSEEAELQLEGDLEGALERGEFELLYQPIVSIASNEVTGFEALVRWQHPVLGMIAPLDFIPIAERTGFIVPLGDWVLREACDRLKQWQTTFARAETLWVSVNLSSVQFGDATLVDRVAEALSASTLDARSLVLELTEGIAMENPTAAKTVLMQLRAMGVRISVDDFGTGYSSLAYLRQFPVDTLKVDRSFVRGMETHKDIAEIVRSLMAMAQQLGLSVVVEGIENHDQLALLRSLRCEFAQGFLFAKPLAGNAAADVIESGLPAQPDDTVALSGKRRVLEPGRHSTRSPSAKWKSVAAASAILACVALVGVVSGVFGGSNPSVGVRSGDVQLEGDAAEEPSGSAAIAEPLPARSSSVVAVKPATPTPLEKMSTPQTPRAATSGQTSLEVRHLHRVGSCRGQLTVSSEGVKFISEEADDVFAFPFGEFLHALADGTLTIRSAARTYRFKTIEDDNASQLADVVAAISRFR